MSTPNRLHRGLALTVSVSALASQTLASDPVIQWNDLYLDAVREGPASPGAITRDLAIMNVAMHDALAAITKKTEPYGPAQPAPKGTSIEAALHTAAWQALVSVRPNQKAMFDAAFAQALASIPNSPSKDAGLKLGTDCAHALLNLRASDGSKSTITYIPSTKPGDWKPTFPDFSAPVTPHWGNVLPWVMDTSEQFRPPASWLPALESNKYANHVNEVKSLGALNSTKRTPYQTETAFFWANDKNGTYKPPGHMISYCLEVSEQQKLNLQQNARLFALTSLAMADGVISCWDAKYDTDRDLWRPIDAIRRADEDNNPKTKKDAGWTPLAPSTPAFPSYTSGHAMFGATHAAILRQFFGRDWMKHTVTSDDGVPGQVRTFYNFTAPALENGRSRIYLGIHYQFDCDVAYVQGTKIGNLIYREALRPTNPADANSDGALDWKDWVSFQIAYVSGLQNADLDRDGKATPIDWWLFVAMFKKGW
jgi:PAP2 superfamily